MELRQPRTQDHVLYPSQANIPDPFLGRHAAFDDVALEDHARAEHHIGLVGQDGSNHFLQISRGLTVTMQENYNTETLLDNIVVADIPVTVTAQFLWVVGHRNARGFGPWRIRWS